MTLSSYLATHFPGVTLQSSVYSQWPYALHFSLGEGLYQLHNDGSLRMERFDRVVQQALTLFYEVFDPDDDCELVTAVFQLKESAKTANVGVYKRGVRKKELLYAVRQEVLPFSGEEEEELKMLRFSLHCAARDLNVPWLMKACCHRDFSLKPRLKSSGSYQPDVFLVNRTKGVIFFVYDDRGCEIIATDKETLRPLFNRYRGWMEEWDLERGINLLSE